MDIRKVAVLGAGAVGSYVIWGLSARRDIELGVVADGPRGERLAKDGCAINGKVYRPAVWTPGQAHDADLLIVCLKYGALPGALDSIKAVTGPPHHHHEPDERRGQRGHHRLCRGWGASALLPHQSGVPQGG